MIVVMLVIPLPTWLLSFLIIINISLSLLYLITAMNMKEALAIFNFSTLIIIIDIIPIRIKCFNNSCHFIKGDAGGVVETFGYIRNQVEIS